MSSDFSTIVHELLELDPTLEPHRAALEQHCQTILAAKPNVQVDAAFKKRLLDDLHHRFAQRMSSTPLPGEAHAESGSSFFSSLFMSNRFVLLGSGAFVGALAVVIVTNMQLPSPTQNLSDSAGVTAEESSLAPNAFGSLATTQNVRAQSGGGGGGMPVSATAPAPAAEAADAEGKRMAIDSAILPYNPTIVEYSYEGNIPLPEGGTVSVLRRTRGQGTSAGVGALLGGALGDLADLSGISGLNIQQVTLNQPGTRGLSISLDFVDQSMWISRMQDPADNPSYRCRDEKCYQQYRMKESDMLPQETLVSIARDFASDMGIDLSAYGEPSIQDDWRVWLAQTPNKADYWFPEQQTVVFPLLINGKTVYEEYGTAYGISFSVDQRTKQVMYVSNLRTNNYQTSDYAAARDVEQVKNALTLGGQQQWYVPQDAKKLTATVGAPTEAYVHIYQWNEQTQTSSELFVPALAFPVTDMPEGSYDARKTVLVPLAQDMIDRILTPPDNGIMPLMDQPAVRDAAAAQEPVAE